MQGQRPSALVLGAGVMGLSAAWGLSRAGFSVRVVDQHAPPNPRGASADDHRLIRHAYGAQAGYMRMVDDAYAAWELLWRDLGESLHVPTGLLCLDETAGPWLGDSRRALRAGGHRTEDLSATEVERRFPLLRGEGLRDAMWVPTGGVLLARRIVEALARHLAQARGVAFALGRAAAVDPVRASLTLDDGHTLSADLLVVAAGPWVPRLLPGALAARVTPSRQLIVRLYPDNLSAWAQMPMLLDLSPSGGFYLVPPVAGTPLKIGDHSFSLEGDPETDPRTPSREEVEAMLGRARKRLVGLDAMQLLGGGVCFYDVEPKERFVLEKLAPAAFAMSGFSGHGFKFAAVLGLALAAAAGDERLAEGVPAWAAGEAPAPEGLLAALQEVPA
jgi:sarcosine oxidase subunit beta